MLVDTDAQSTVLPPPVKTNDEPKRRPMSRELAGLLKFSALAVQLALIAILIKRYNLESPAFFQLTLLAFCGFGVHYFLPLAYRLPFFLLLSLASIVLVLGWQEGAWLVGIGLALIGVCHLPVAFSIRVILLIGLGGLLVAMRAGWVPAPLPVAIWPILASMFMFRLILYVRELRFQTSPTTLTSSLSYFFMLPNVCFPLFPVVDYQSFCRNYYDEDRDRIHQVGVRWIFRGVVHLLLYRIIYKNYSISLYEVANAGDLVHYCLWLFLLYLRVSGQFHIIVGMLRLFGFNLDETHHLYYLSSSFTDFWRRINIYWKDFMVKLFFFPVYFRLQRGGATLALVVSTLLVFFLTWLLHAVQWFWLRGSFLWAANDIVFWSILATLVVVNTLWETKHGRQRRTPSGGISWSGTLGLALKTLATFTVICVLWSLWTSESLTAWLTLWQFALVRPTAQGWLLIAGVVVAILGGAVLIARNQAAFPWSRLSLIPEAAARCAVMTLLAAISITGIHQRLGPISNLVAAARSSSLNREDQSEVERGYYEGLLAVDTFNLALFDLYTRRPPEWAATIVDVGLATPTNDFQRFELKPSVEGLFKGAMLRTNRWGMHDKEYSLEPPPNCYRIAMLGASHAMGTGVERDRTFEALLEQRLNAQNDGIEYDSVEILNFAVWAYRPIQQIKVLQEKVLPFKPNAVFYVEHPGDNRRLIVNLVEAIKQGIEPPYPYLRDVIKQAGIDSSTPEPIIRRRLKPFIDDMVAWLYRDLVRVCNEQGILPVYVSLPTVNPDQELANIEPARAAGFKILDLKGVYDGHKWWDLMVSKWDAHPTAEGHRLVAERLYDVMAEEGVIPVTKRVDADGKPEKEASQSGRKSIK